MKKTMDSLIAFKSKKKAGRIYIVQCNEFIKIGLAENCAARIQSMQAGCPYDLILLHSFPVDDSLRLEDALHVSLKCYRHRGEWFQLPESIIDTLSRFTQADCYALLDHTGHFSKPPLLTSLPFQYYPEP